TAFPIHHPPPPAPAPRTGIRWPRPTTAAEAIGRRGHPGAGPPSAATPHRGSYLRLRAGRSRMRAGPGSAAGRARVRVMHARQAAAAASRGGRRARGGRRGIDPAARTWQTEMPGGGMAAMRPETPADPERLQRAPQARGPPRTRAHLPPLQKLLSDPTRLRIVQALRAGPLAVSDLTAVIGRAPEATSQHLRILRAHEVVEGSRRGTHFFYHLSSGGASAKVQDVLKT